MLCKNLIAFKLPQSYWNSDRIKEAVLCVYLPYNLMIVPHILSILGRYFIWYHSFKSNPNENPNKLGLSC